MFSSVNHSHYANPLSDHSCYGCKFCYATCACLIVKDMAKIIGDARMTCCIIPNDVVSYLVEYSYM